MADRDHYRHGSTAKILQPVEAVAKVSGSDEEDSQAEWQRYEKDPNIIIDQSRPPPASWIRIPQPAIDRNYPHRPR